jgi:predicted nucleic acid-binding Zn ribbon protein
MSEISSKKKGRKGEERTGPECLEARHEIMMSVFAEDGIVTQAASIHLERCGSCREWEAEFKRMHAHCRTSTETAPVAAATEILYVALDSAVLTQETSSRAIGPRRMPEGAPLLLTLLAVVAFEAVLASMLGGTARIFYPGATGAAMLFASVWVHVDSRRRGVPSAFWTALQPLTIPFGLLAYLVCRGRESVRCSGCGALMPSGRQFCPSCGERLVEICCRCGEPVRREFRICPQCGVVLEGCGQREGAVARACGWTRGQVAFLIAGNAVLLAAAVAVMTMGSVRASVSSSALYFLGFLPVFNWVSIDSKRRGMNSIGWGALVFFTLYLGLVVYLACRSDVPVECPVCGSHSLSDFKFCPFCGSHLASSCPSCGAAIGVGERFCSSCGETLV